MAAINEQLVPAETCRRSRHTHACGRDADIHDLRSAACIYLGGETMLAA